MMGATIQLAMRGGMIVALPVMLVGVYTLVRPVIPTKIHRFIVLFAPATVLCFLIGGAFAYFVMLPTGLGFLLHFGDGVAVPLINILDYLEMMMSMIFWLGVIFEMPVAMYLLAKTEIISYRRMRNLRKFVPVTAIILAAIITPTVDAVNLTLVAVPIIVLYEVGMFCAWLAHPERGNYLWLGSIGRGIRWTWRRPIVFANWVQRLWLRAVTRIRRLWPGD
jgi:sec-independent protein translocase protein TatC